MRRRQYIARGPNCIWHIDGNDKLLPYGFAIHGAIDGYSRKILWLKVSKSSKNPGYVARYFVDYVRNLNGVPKRIRADRGVENSRVAGLQRYFRMLHDDADSGMRSFLFGKSTSNQRIEAWWSFLRRSLLNWWMNYSKDMRDQALFDDSNDLHVECLRFCFYSILQDELYETVENWNHHRIRPSRMAESPHGRPDVLYFLPQNQGQDVRDYKQPVAAHDLDLTDQIYCENTPMFCCTNDFAELAFILMDEHNLEMPRSANEAEIL